MFLISLVSRNYYCRERVSSIFLRTLFQALAEHLALTVIRETRRWLAGLLPRWAKQFSDHRPELHKLAVFAASRSPAESEDVTTNTRVSLQAKLLRM